MDLLSLERHFARFFPLLQSNVSILLFSTLIEVIQVTNFRLEKLSNLSLRFESYFYLRFSHRCFLHDQSKLIISQIFKKVIINFLRSRDKENTSKNALGTVHSPIYSDHVYVKENPKYVSLKRSSLKRRAT